MTTSASAGVASGAGSVRHSARVSARIGAITESATLAVDAKAKALKAAGRPVIGFGGRRAGLPDTGLHRRGRRSRPAATPAITGTPPRPGCRS